MVKAGDGYDIRVNLTPGWAAGKAYPIVIDPSLAWWGYIVGSPLPTVEGYNSDCAPTACAHGSTINNSNYLFTGAYGGVVRARSYADYVLKTSTSVYVPDRAQITSAAYQLYFDACIGNPISQSPYQDLCTNHAGGRDLYTVALDRMAQPWSGSDSETTLGSKAVPAAIPTPQVSTTAGRDNSLNWNIAPLMQSWVDYGQPDYLPDHGVQVRQTGDSTINDGGPVFDSSTHMNQGADNGGTAGRPILAIAWNEIPPSAPTNVTAVPVADTNGNNTQAKVTWTIPTGGTEPSDYVIYAKTADTNVAVAGYPFDYSRSAFGMCGDGYNLVACTGNMSYTVTGLTPGVTYNFSVQAANNAPGPGPISTVAQATMWLPPVISMTPGAASTTSGDQGSWTLNLTNPNDRPTPAAALVQLPAGLSVTPLTGWIKTAGTNTACVTAATLALSTPPGDCFYDGPNNAFFASAPTIAAKATTTVAFDAVARTASLPCDAQLFSVWATIPSGMGSYATGTQLGANTGQACNAGLGREPWWSFADRPIGPQATASVNVANGNLLVNQTDTTAVQGHGQLSYSLARSYNSQLTAAQSAASTASIGQGWQLNLSDLGDFGASPVANSLLEPLNKLGPVTALADMVLSSAVTLVNADGTRHTFTPNPATVGLDLKVHGVNLATLVDQLKNNGLGGLVDSVNTLLSTWSPPPNTEVGVCLATSYNSPPGVHESLWRYVVVALPSPVTGCTPQTPPTGSPLNVSLGYSVMRPDRVTEVFDLNGRLTGLFDRSGNELLYQYNPAGQLTSISEPKCAINGGVHCRAITLNWGGTSSTAVTVTDPAGRTVTYNRSAPPLNSQLTSVVTADAAGHVIETWTYHYNGDSVCPGATPTGALCQVVDPNSVNGAAPAATGFIYRTGAGAPMVTQIAERAKSVADATKAITTTIAYNTGSTDVARGTYTDPATRGVTVDAQRYNNIDASGRVAQVLQGGEVSPGATAFTAYAETDMMFDTAGCLPRQPAKADNALCKVTHQALPLPAGQSPPPGWAMTPNSVETFQYSPLGQVLADTVTPGGTAAPITTTNGYRTVYTDADGTITTLVDTPTGNGALSYSQTRNGVTTTGANPPPATALYAVSDQTSALAARGNDAGANTTPYLTSYTVDNNPSAAPGQLAGGCGSGNTGLVCRQSVPAPQDATAALQVTSYTYDAFGQRASMTSPAVNALLALGGALPAADGCAVTTGALPCATLYDYYHDNATDLSGLVSAGGWLKGVTDPYGHFVAYGYDRAGHTVRTWDRDATTNNNQPLTSYPLAAGPGSNEMLYVDPAGGDALADPWRYKTSTTDQMGNRSTYSVDGDGNPTAIRPPRGNQAGNATFDTVETFDANDRLTSTRLPGNTTPTTVRYDDNANAYTTTDADGHVTATVYDPIGRPVAGYFTRGPWNTATAPATCVQSDGTAPAQLPTGTIAAGASLCNSSTGYDGQGHPIVTVDANATPTWAAFDGTGRKTAQITMRAAAVGNTAAVWETARQVYDSAGNVTSSCPARQAAEEPSVACGPGAHLSTQTLYDPLNRPSAVTNYRQATNADGTVAAGWQTLTTTTGYQLAAAVAADTKTLPATTFEDPNGTAGYPGGAAAHTTVTVADLNGRKIQQQTPRDNTTATVTRWEHSPAGDQTATVVYPATTNGTTTTLAAASDITAARYDAAHRLVDTVDAATSPPNGPAAAAAANSDSYLAAGGAHPANIRTRTVYDADSHVVGVYQPTAFTASVTAPNAEYLTRVDYDTNGRATAQWVPVYDAAAAVPIAANTNQAACPTTGGGWGPAVVAGVAGYPASVGICRSAASYDPVGNINEIDNPAGNDPAVGTAAKTTYSYTNDNLVAAVTTASPAPGGPATIAAHAYTYDAIGRPTTIVDAAGTSANPTNLTTTTTWTPDGLAAQTQTQGSTSCTTNAVNHLQTVTFNAAGQPSAVDTQIGGGFPDDITATSYFADGKTFETKATAVTTHPVGGGADVTADQTTRYGYDPNGNPITIWSPSAVAKAANNPGPAGATAGSPTIDLYSSDNLLTQQIVPVDPAGGARRADSYSYDPFGRTLSKDTAQVTVANLAAYPNIGVTVTADAGSQRYTYSANGWTLTQAGRVIGTGAATDNLAYSYTADGQAAAVTDTALGGQATTVANAYYPNDQLRTSTTTVNANPAYTTKTTGFGYTADGLIAAQAESSDPTLATTDAAQTYSYGTARTLSAVNSVGFGQAAAQWTVTSDTAGRTVAMSDPNNNQTTICRLADGTVANQTLTNPSGGTLDSWSYAYNQAGQITNRTRSGAANTVDNYSYDQAGRVSTVDGQNVSYDPNGNRLAVGTAGTTYTYRADNAIATQTTPTQGATTDSYDNAGNLLADGCHTTSYDSLDRLTTTAPLAGTPTSCAAGSNTGTVTNEYDGLDRQTRATTTGTATGNEVRQLHYLGTSTTLYSQDTDNPSGITTAHYTNTPAGTPLAVADGQIASKLQTLSTDGQNNTVAALNANAVVCTASLDPWGSVTGSPCGAGTATPASANTLWYNNTRRDNTTGTYNLGARTYNPSTATWLTPDTNRASTATTNQSVGTDPLTANTYTYANGDPINLNDPTGHFSGTFCRANDIDQATCAQLTRQQNAARAAADNLGGQEAVAQQRIAAQINSIQPSASISPPVAIGGRITDPGVMAYSPTQEAELAYLRHLQGEQVLYYDPTTGQVAVVYGNLTGATHVAIVLDGTNSGGPSFVQGAEKKALAIESQACLSPVACSTTATIAYDYGPPGSPVSAVTDNQGVAHRAASELIGLTSMVRGDAPRAALTAIGHSYGSLVVGIALRQGLNVDNAIFTGSSGEDVNNVAGFNTHARVFNALAADDNASQIATCAFKTFANPYATCGEYEDFYGRLPSDPTFGAAQLDVTGAHGHNEYYLQGSQSLYSITGVVTGRP